MDDFAHVQGREPVRAAILRAATLPSDFHKDDRLLQDGAPSN